MFFWPYRLVSNYQLNAQFLYSVTMYMLHYNPRHVSSSTMLIFSRTNCISTASGIVTLCKQPYSTLSTSILYGCLQSDDTRCCNNTIWPPEDEHSTARNTSRIMMWHIYCYRIKELCIKLVIWNKSILWCTVRKTSNLPDLLVDLCSHKTTWRHNPGDCGLFCYYHDSYKLW